MRHLLSINEDFAGNSYKIPMLTLTPDATKEIKGKRKVTLQRNGPMVLTIENYINNLKKHGKLGKLKNVRSLFSKIYWDADKIVLVYK